MEKMEMIKEELKRHAFLKLKDEDTWINDDLTVRFDNDRMEIYEKIKIKGKNRYLISDIDIDILQEALSQL